MALCDRTHLRSSRIHLRFSKRLECNIFQGNCFPPQVFRLKAIMVKGAVFIPAAVQVYSCYISAHRPKQMKYFLLLSLMTEAFSKQLGSWFRLLAITLLRFSVRNLCLGFG